MRFQILTIHENSYLRVFFVRFKYFFFVDFLLNLNLNFIFIKKIILIKKLFVLILFQSIEKILVFHQVIFIFNLIFFYFFKLIFFLFIFYCSIKVFIFKMTFFTVFYISFRSFKFLMKLLIEVFIFFN